MDKERDNMPDNDDIVWDYNDGSENIDDDETEELDFSHEDDR